MKPCWASWRRWYDVAPVLSPSRWASAVAVVEPSVRRIPRIRSRTGWVRARSCWGVGVIELVSTTTNISLQRTICKYFFVVGTVSEPASALGQRVVRRAHVRLLAGRGALGQGFGGDGRRVAAGDDVRVRLWFLRGGRHACRYPR